VAVVLRSLAAFSAAGAGQWRGRGLAVLSLLAIFAGLGAMFGGLVSDQFVELGRQLPGAVDAAQTYLDRWHIDYNLSEMAKVAKFSSIFQRASGFVISIGGWWPMLRCLWGAFSLPPIRPLPRRDAASIAAFGGTIDGRRAG
jgi:predicted PurR-regulated permease PerM